MSKNNGSADRTKEITWGGNDVSGALNTSTSSGTGDSLIQTNALHKQYKWARKNGKRLKVMVALLLCAYSDLQDNMRYIKNTDSLLRLCNGCPVIVHKKVALLSELFWILFKSVHTTILCLIKNNFYLLIDDNDPLQLLQINTLCWFAWRSGTFWLLIFRLRFVPYPAYATSGLTSPYYAQQTYIRDCFVLL